MAEATRGRSPNVWRMWFWRVVLLVGTVGLFLVLRPGGGDEEGRRLPAFSLPALFGDETWTEADLAGKPVVLNFWASWCEPCREEAPMLDEFSRRYSGEVLIVGVDVQDSPLAARQFAREYDLSYPLIQDLEQDLYRALRETDGLPQTYFVRPDGSIVTSGPAAPALGELEEDQLEAAIEALLEEG
ncbi:MAG: TlpA family protein disulfide reductase [Actinomycetota bacterium]